MVVVETWLNSDVVEGWCLGEKQRWPCLSSETAYRPVWKVAWCCFRSMQKACILLPVDSACTCTLQLSECCTRNARCEHCLHVRPGAMCFPHVRIPFSPPQLFNIRVARMYRDRRAQGIRGRCSVARPVRILGGADWRKKESKKQLTR